MSEPIGALTGLTVVDLSQHIAGPLVAMTLADLGAEVIRVDPPGGPRMPSAANAMFQRGKRSLTLDLGAPDDRATLQGLLDRADVLVESFRPGRMTAWGMAPDALLSRNPRLVHLSLPGFSPDDPRSQVPAWEGVLDASAGFYLYPRCSPMNYVGDRTKDPIFSAVPQSSAYGAAVALHTVAAALVARERDGRGQHIDMSLHEAAFELIGANAIRTPDRPAAPAAPAPGIRKPHLDYYRGSDGKWLELCLFQDKHLTWFAASFMPQEWIDDGMADPIRMMDDAPLQARARERLRSLIGTRPAREWEIAINELSGASAAIVQSAQDWLTADTHARDSGAVIELVDPELGPTAMAGYPFLLSRTPLEAQGPRHRLDSDRFAVLARLSEPVPLAPAPSVAPLTSALQGVRVIDLAQVLAGPTTSRILAEYGASVVKIHNPDDRQLGMHLYTNSGKASMTVDLKTDDGMRIFRRLADGVDVFVQNFTRGVADRLGVGEADVRELSPDVIYTSISAFGHEGYRGGWRGREQLGQGPTGMQLRLSGYDSTPQMAPFPYTDFLTGNLAAAGVVFALYHRLRTGVGQHVHASLTQSGTFLQAPFMVAFEGKRWDEPAGGDAKGWNAWDRLYRGADDRWFYLAAPDDAARRAAAAATGLTEAADEDALSSVFEMRTAAEWVAALQGAGVGAHLLMDLSELMDDEYAIAKGLVVSRHHDGTGVATMAGPSPRLTRTPARATAPVGPPGSDTRAVLSQLGYEDAEINRLVDAGVVRERPEAGAASVGMFR